jgi:hypothetical protein
MTIANGNPSDDEILGSLSQPSPGTPEEPAAAAPAEAPAPVEQPFDPSAWSYKFRNETVHPKDRNDMTELLQLGHSYRVNKPKWEKDQQTLQAYEARKADYQRYDQLSEALKANPAFQSELEQLAQKYSGQPSQPAQPANLAEDPRLKQFEEFIEQQRQREADTELARELDELEKTEARFDWKSDSGEGNLRNQLLRYMSENKIYNARVAFRDMKWNEAQEKKEFEARRKAEEDAARARKLGTVAPGTAPAPSAQPKPIDYRNASYEQLEQMAVESLGR